ncbi:MAG: hypothetical protein WAN52_19945, partial [Pseudolabrys sp.]
VTPGGPGLIMARIVEYSPSEHRSSHFDQSSVTVLFAKTNMPTSQLDVRFGSKAEMCSATRHVRFVP